MSQLADQLDAVLPQTQCTQCGYAGCRPYAEALARGEADLNQCPPGGDAGIAKLAALLGRKPRPLNPAHGEHRPPTVAVIDEAECIGCARCLKPCPVDAIVGASKFLHTVIASVCTGCELCLPVCPVDCIRMVAVPALPAADVSRQRFNARNLRVDREKLERAAYLEAIEANSSSQV